MLVRSESFFPVCNFSPGRKGNKVSHIILFTTLTTGLKQTVEICNAPSEERSYHLIINRQGKIIQTVLLPDTAWHSDNSRIEEINNKSIGIILCTTGNSFSKEQIDSLIWILSKLIFIFNIESNCILGFEDISHFKIPSPGPNFNWNAVLNRVYLDDKRIYREYTPKTIRINKEFLGKNVYGGGKKISTYRFLSSRNFVKW